MKTIKQFIESQNFLIKGHTKSQIVFDWKTDLYNNLEFQKDKSVWYIKGHRADLATNTEYKDKSKIKFRGWIKLWIYIADNPGQSLDDILDYCNDTKHGIGNYSKAIINGLVTEHVLNKDNNKYYSNPVSKWTAK